MPYVPTQFWSGSPQGPWDQVLYTVPAGQTAIITEVLIAPSGPTSTFLYGGPTRWLYNCNPHTGIRGDWPPDHMVQLSLFTVLTAGETIVFGNQLNNFIHISGLLGSGTIGGRTPARLGHVQSVNGSGADQTVCTGGANGTIIQQIVVSYTGTGGAASAALRHGAAPIRPWSAQWSFAPQETKIVDGPYVLNSGQNLVFNDWGGSGAGQFACTAYGWTL